MGAMAAKAAAAFEKLSSLEARFVKDVNIFDGTEVAPGSKITKIWRLQNSGLTSWPQHTRLMHVGGQKLGEQDSVSLEVRRCDIRFSFLLVDMRKMLKLNLLYL